MCLSTVLPVEHFCATQRTLLCHAANIFAMHIHSYMTNAFLQNYTRINGISFAESAVININTKNDNFSEMFQFSQYTSQSYITWKLNHWQWYFHYSWFANSVELLFTEIKSKFIHFVNDFQTFQNLHIENNSLFESISRSLFANNVWQFVSFDVLCYKVFKYKEFTNNRLIE